MNKRWYATTKNPAVASPDAKMLAFIAGFYEGEGGVYGKGHTQHVEISQRNREILDVIRYYVGGHVWFHEGNEQWMLTMTGARARGFVLTIYGMLSRKKQHQVWEALYVATPQEISDEAASKIQRDYYDYLEEVYDGEKGEDYE